MAITSEMTVSISKGKQSESSDEHNDRKTNLAKASEKKKDAFYTKTGHKHIHREYTDLNEDLLIRKPSEAYDEIFEDSIKEYNDSKTRNDRKIGKGLASTVKEKQGKIALLTMVHKYKQIKSAKKQQEFLKDLTKKQPEMAKSLKSVLPNFKNLSLRDTSKLLTKAKHAKTLGQAYYEKQKHSKQSRTAVEFVMQVGSAEDFNEIDENGRIIKSYDRTDPNGVWQKSKKVLKDYYKEFKKNNPNLIPINASIHMDESTPHLHLKIIPVADRDQMQMRGHGTIDKKTGKIAKKARHTGLSKKVSYNGALENEGFKRDSSDNRSQFKEWQNREADTLAKIMQKELGVKRTKGYTNRLKNVHEYKKVKEAVAKQRENANTYKQIADKNSVLANKNYAIYQNNSKAVKKVQANLENLNENVAEAQKKLSDVSKERQKQLDLVAREIAQKRSERLRELSRELEEKRKKEDKKLKSREDAVKQREDDVKQRETKVKNHEKDLNAVQYGGIDSKGIKHKSLEQRVKAGIAHGIKQVQKALLQPIKAFTYAYRTSMVKQKNPEYTKEQVKTVANRQENYLAHNGGAKARILRELASDKYERSSIKAIRSGTKALAKALPSYDAVDEAIEDSILLDQLEHAEQQHAEQQKQIPTSKTKDDSPDMDDF